MTIKCPKCKSELQLNIVNAIDEDGESFMCNECGWIFRYAER